MRRVMVIGAPGSGKSTLAIDLGARTGLPVFHMDHIHHLPGWAQRPHADKLRMAAEVEAREAWIFEGGFSATYANRAERADTIVWLDLPVWLSLWRVTKRLLRHRGTVRPDMAEGCPEQFSAEFYHYIVTSDRRTRERNARFVARYPDKAVRLRSRRAVRDWLARQGPMTHMARTDEGAS